MESPLDKAGTLLGVVQHVFLPPKLPQQALSEAYEHQVDHRLIDLALGAVGEYRGSATGNTEQWARMSHMLSALARNVEAPLERLQDDMASMQTDDILALHIRAQNAAVLIRKSSTATTFEIFEAQAPAASVMSVPGKLVRQFPGPAIQVPSSIANDPNFIEEVANFLSRMDVEVLDDATNETTDAGSPRLKKGKGKKAGPRDEAPDCMDPHYISQFFTGILRGFGEEVKPHRVVKRIADEVLWDGTHLPWRRSPTWLIIRIALHTSLDSTREYKCFMVYFHAHLLQLAGAEPGFSSDLLYSMRVKMARRLVKIQDLAPPFVIEAAKQACDRTQKVLQERWDAIQAEVPELQPLILDMDVAAVQSLPNSRQYISKVLKGRSELGNPPAFVPSHLPRLTGYPDFSVFANGALSKAFSNDKHAALFDFENAVHTHLSGWLDANLNEESSSAIVFSCFEQYDSAAQSYYTQDVADLSIMVLTIMALWVALDRLITSQHNLLRDHSPDIPEYLIEVLLLRSPLHLEQATMVQTYLRRRHAQSSLCSVFSGTFTQDSFPVRFFNQSSRLQDLKREIEQVAESERNQKLDELSKLNAEHGRLRELIASSVCHYWEDSSGHRYHSGSCDHCRLQSEASAMTIRLHEWPLPSGQLDAEAVVFELECPDALNHWRSATYKILCDLGGSTREGQLDPGNRLAGYQGLTKWSSRLRSSKHRITIASSAKSFVVAHRSDAPIPASEKHVCVNNGLIFKPSDSAKNTWATSPFTKTSFTKYGTFTLPPSSPYRYLQYSLGDTSHTSNQILADQSDCPRELNLHDHYAFGTLRSGPRLQWMNIVRGLEENILTFSHEEVCLLHTQAAWQIGHLSEDNQTRDWHLELVDPQYSRLLVTLALRVLDRVRSNWLEATSVKMIIILVARLLSSTTDPATRNKAYYFLREARTVTFGWLRELLSKLQDAKLESEECQQRVCEMASVCRSTYDVDASHLSELLSSQEDYLALVLCSVTLYDNQPTKLEDAPPNLQMLLSRDRRLAYKVLPVMVQKLGDMPRFLDASVSHCWNGYRPGSTGWVALPAPNSRWVFTTTAPASAGAFQQVHLNLLEGSLLVDGQPLRRLPRNYVTHPTYIRLFGQASL
ncbi:hypothetical protein FRC10_011492 [Ceratobasidium sp. 414]|nr:hypothetical protein FRC10_011492 [Ceratobasidium sp. 414]